VIYLAIGDKHCREAEKSIASLKRHMPDLPVTVYTDAAIDREGVDEVVPLPAPAYDRTCNIRVLSESPYEKTLFLDTDTLVCTPFPEVFGLLERFEVAGVLGPKIKGSSPVGGVPACFSQYNAGVLLLRRCGKTDAFLSLWKKLYEEDLGVFVSQASGKAAARNYPKCQPSLRRALFASDVRIATLPLEYNFRFRTGGFLKGPVRVLHGRRKIDEVARLVNRHLGQRMVYMEKGKVKMKPGRLELFLAGLKGSGKSGGA